MIEENSPPTGPLFLNIFELGRRKCATAEKHHVVIHRSQGTVPGLRQQRNGKRDGRCLFPCHSVSCDNANIRDMGTCIGAPIDTCNVYNLHVTHTHPLGLEISGGRIPLKKLAIFPFPPPLKFW